MGTAEQAEISRDERSGSYWLEQAYCEYLSACVIQTSVPNSNRQVITHIRGALRDLAKHLGLDSSEEEAVVQPEGELGADDLQTFYRKVCEALNCQAQHEEDWRSAKLEPHLRLLKKLIGLAYRKERGASYRVLRSALKKFMTVALPSLLALYVILSLWRGAWNPRYWLSRRLGSLLIVSAKQDWGDLAFNTSLDRGPLSVGKNKFSTGLGTHAFSTIKVLLPRQARWFRGGCGVDDEMGGAGSVRCSISGEDGKTLFASPVVKGGDAPVRFRVSVEGLRELTLAVDDGGDGGSFDHADWIDLLVE